MNDKTKLMNDKTQSNETMFSYIIIFVSIIELSMDQPYLLSSIVEEVTQQNKHKHKKVLEQNSTLGNKLKQEMLQCDEKINVTF